MLKLDYLKTVLQYEAGKPNKAYLQRTWAISAFAIVIEAPDAYQKNPYLHRLVRTVTGVYFVDGDGQLVQITDADQQPLFRFTDTIKVDPTWAPNITGEIETTVGRMFVNQVAISGVFGAKVPYVNKSFKVGDIEDYIAKRLEVTPKDPSQKNGERIYIDEYCQFVDRLQYISALSTLCNYSATRKNIVAPPGIDKFRSELAKEYGDRIKDPVVLSEFEAKLKAYADEYLQDDPSNGIFLSGRTKDNGYRRMFLEFGADMQLRPSTSVVPIVKPLTEGWSTDPTEFTAMMNGIRAGSYSRGLETVNGGVTAKSLLRSLGSYTIKQEDCGSKLGLVRTFSQKDWSGLIGRYVQDGNTWKLVADEEQARQYADQTVTMRSPMYCQSTTGSFCRICTGEKLALNPNGLSLAATDVSAVILSASLKAMHGKVLSTARFDYTKHLT